MKKKKKRSLEIGSLVVQTLSRFGNKTHQLAKIENYFGVRLERLALVTLSMMYCQALY